MKISDLERELLVTIQFCPGATALELSKKIKHPVHQIQYALQKIHRLQVTKHSVLIDFRALGLEQYEMYFSLYPKSSNSRKNTLGKLFQHEKVFWYAELGGSQPFGMSFIAFNSSDAAHFIESLSSKEDPLFNSKEIASIISYTAFEKSYLRPSYTRGQHRASLTIGRKARKNPNKKATIDFVDSSILKALLSNSSESRPQLSKKLGIPRATLEYRIKRLFEEGICIAPLVFISALKLGFQVYKILITTKGVHPKLSEELYTFSYSEPHVVTYIHTLGSWDFELVLEVATGQQVSLFVERLLERHNDQITKIEILPVFDQGVSVNFSITE